MHSIKEIQFKCNKQFLLNFDGDELSATVHSPIFEGLAILQEQELCERYMGKFPVISITLKDIAGGTFETARAMLCSVIGREAVRFQDQMAALVRSLLSQTLKGNPSLFLLY